MLRQFVVRLTPQIGKVTRMCLRTSAAMSGLKSPIQPTVLKSIREAPSPIPKLPSPKMSVQKKRAIKKKARGASPNIFAYSTCEEYQLDVIRNRLADQGLYDVRELPEETEALHAKARYVVDAQHRDIFFFKEGTVVFWNFTEIEARTVLKLLKGCETGPYDEDMVEEELEVMEFQFHNAKTRVTNGKVLLSANEPEEPDAKVEKQADVLEMYAFSNGIALSVKLAIWEAVLEKYVDSIECMLEDIRHGRKLAATRDHVFRKTGELFALRHSLNLSSDFLDTPDFYWDRADLESLFTKAIRLYSIERRTRVMNEKINHCQELMELISHHLEDKHHVRLELMIIILIVIEVIFECVHYAERYQQEEE
ncbi:required for meiotic nuclear division protein 1 homolog [Galendromus occidentalis]|uniref:Required for meiotic nuclear division protein 1 homolog n=1 Tax=Galendromus occidentalis TaxID=34638 RepID=A0AAJ6VZX2_9ACAR|nr:required for meiotic nuclear division protein 1 homolog [Galendromus occidentalis]